MMDIETVVLQPTSFCNLNCDYCYVQNRKDYTKISFDVLEKAIKLVLPSKSKGNINFIYHAGEPLVVGVNFYKKVLDIISKHKPSGLTISNSLQTNATLINKKWGEFFNKNQFHVSVSIDGPEFLHNLNRKNWSNKGTYHKTLNGYKILKNSGLNPGVLTVITYEHLDYPEELFNFYINNEINKVGLILEEPRYNSKLTSLSTNKNMSIITRYQLFIEKLIDLWLKNPNVITIREINDSLNAFLQKKQNKTFVNTHQEIQDLKIITIQKNGNISTYSPEFAELKSKKYNNFTIGNVMNLKSLDELKNNITYLSIKKDIDLRKLKCKTECSYFDFCGGSFASDVFASTGNFETTENINCVLQKKILSRLLISKLQNKLFSLQ